MRCARPFFEVGCGLFMLRTPTVRRTTSKVLFNKWMEERVLMEEGWHELKRVPLPVISIIIRCIKTILNFLPFRIDHYFKNLPKASGGYTPIQEA